MGSLDIDEWNTPVRTRNVSLFRGIKRHAIEEFVEYMKHELPGRANPDMTVTIEPFSTTDLDVLAKEFLG